MTESSELATAQRHSENHLRRHAAMTEGYRAASEDKTEAAAPSHGGGGGVAAVRYNAEERRDDEAKASAVASSQMFHSDGGEMEPETMEIKSVGEYFTKMHLGSVCVSGQRGRQREAGGQVQGDTCESSDRSQATSLDSSREEPPHLVGKYNAFTVRDSYYMNQLDLGRNHFQERHQKWQQRAPGHKMAERLSPECLSDSRVSHADRSTAKREKRDPSERSQQTDDHLPSPSKGPVLAEGDAASQDGEQQRVTSPPSEQDGAPSYEYHVGKRMSSLQSEGAHSLQSSQCSSIDAGCSTGSSSCVTPMDSPLCAADTMHALSESSVKGMTYVTAEERASGQGRAGHSTDHTLLRKSHAATGAEPGLGITREGSHRMPKIKETTGTTKLEGPVS
ncbi:FERM and PDZ domain-containing protein 4 [Liparis tanakae]|uniref:FERM and PDZ domain-containing protein 4 n=1 Tax=Liparis tanakae TaxID=230148 RepID=A0A4Z2GF27_9TELE|nr:FERM and PDZ domain-containing protein 4 [Liparis tanakae]